MSLCFPLFSVAQNLGYVPGEVIVKVKGASDSVSAYSFQAKARVRRAMVMKTSWDRLNMYHYALKPGQDLQNTLSTLNNDPDVEYAEPNYYVSKAASGEPQKLSDSQMQQVAQTSSTSDPMTGAPINGTQVWQYESTSTSSSIPIVAVIDSGLDTTHPVFVNSGAIWTNPNEIANNGIDDDHNGYIDDVVGWNFVSASNQMLDDDGHGTHVSGIILGVGQNIYDSSHMSPAKIRIMPLKFLDSNGVGSTSNAINAIYYAINNGATIVNNSWGGSAYSAALQDAIAATYTHGMVFSAAAGNAAANNDTTDMYPANYNVPNVISVAATDDNDNLASFSNFGMNSVHVGSPGVYILSTLPGGYYGSMSGTSMATPFVSGIAALMKREAPHMLGNQIRSILMTQVDQQPQLASSVISRGRVNTLNSISGAKYAAVLTTQPTYSAASVRSPASADSTSAAGCGRVQKMATDVNNQGRGNPPNPLGKILVISMLLAPIVMILRMRKQDGKDQRRYERFQLNSEVRLKMGDHELVGSVSTISMGGVQINTKALLEKGGIVSMKISSPDGVEQIEVAGEIVWSAENKAYGVAFSNASLKTLDQIENWSKALAKAD